ncbi:NAD(P)-dependent dehydrogenase, short-chain alcohol dehydrogenase family [Pedobacter westerhofensis]|uniref:NAD(P)-dependent dehydrogenase, short-chain alcohol dehydrogenase family n=1 Tax=Pedobacter westerhofensis TaxID=425512 RepID=A0A521ET20_9SPHI|nr:SDR family NAD(P)-dependent oxidoreductase [Pedobacter westerhofensis]SMO87057.1 NAD(P)-dependent dehydrogenase, short-chain alcohol dehydrogenase family [Pedobacter westerhofensis]
MEVLGNKVVLITGGAGALGLVTAKLYLAKGSSVMLADRNQEALERAAKMLNHQNLACVVADVTNTADTRFYVNETVRLFGKIDVFIHCVGIIGMIRPVEQISEQEFSYAKWVNFSGAWLGCQYVLPEMNDGGSVILVSSTAGHWGAADTGRYTESKHAMVRMMQTLSLEVAHRNIRVNTIDPINFEGRMMRDPEEVLISGNKDELKKIMKSMIPLGRYVHPEDVAHSLLFFGSVSSTYITGTTHVIAGGFNS